MIFLSAAHCNGSKRYGNMKFVKLGMIDRSQNDQNVSIYNVVEIIEHPKYTPRTLENDIALLKLDKDVIFTEFTYPICLPTIQPEHSKAVVTGLGLTGRDHSQSQKLLKVVLEKFSKQECQNIFDTKNITNNMLCYGSHSEEKDSCGVRF